MKKVLNILLAIDGNYEDQALLAEVELIAKKSCAQVALLDIHDSSRANAAKSVVVAELIRVDDRLREMQLDSLSTELTKMGIPVTVEHATGKPFLEIIRKTLGGDYDLVIKPASKEVGLKQLLIGGTDVQLMSLCPTPVWIFQPTVNRHLKNIVIAVDLRPDDLERTLLAKNVLEWGNHIGALVGAEIHVIHAWNVYREFTLRASPQTSIMIDQLVREKKQLHSKWLDDALQRVWPNSNEVHGHLVKGDAKTLILKEADNLSADLLVMGTMGRTGIPGFFIGNTADAVLRKISCSVLTIKPEKFSTPVKQAA